MALKGLTMRNQAVSKKLAEDAELFTDNDTYTFRGPRIAVSCHVQWDQDRSCWLASSADGFRGSSLHDRPGAALACFEAWLTGRRGWYEEPLPDEHDPAVPELLKPPNEPKPDPYSVPFEQRLGHVAYTELTPDGIYKICHCQIGENHPIEIPDTVGGHKHTIEPADIPQPHVAIGSISATSKICYCALGQNHPIRGHKIVASPINQENIH